MSKQQTLTALLLAGTIVLSPSLLVGQEKVAAQRKIQPTEEVDLIIKELLGQVYVECGGLEELLWFDLEPLAEEYAKALLQAREMSDGKAASQMMREKRVKFEADIDAKLTESQKGIRAQKRAEQEAWLQQVESLYQPAADSARNQFSRMNNNESVKSVKIEFK